MMKAMTSVSINKTLSDSEWERIVDSISSSSEGSHLVSFSEVYELAEHNEVNK